MADTQNVTLAIPKEILRKAKMLALEKNTSLSRLLTQTLVDLVTDKEGYEQARRQNPTHLRIESIRQHPKPNVRAVRTQELTIEERRPNMC